jgi:hypothetical protein
MRPDGFWRSCGLPVLVSAGVFCALNALWKNPRIGPTLAGVLPYPLVVFVLGGSGLALVFVTRALRTGRLTRHDLGLELAGWSAPRRLAGLALLVLFSYGQLALLQRQLAGQRSQPTWGDYCFNYFICLSASLAELLVFLAVGFCHVEGWLRRRGAGRLPAAAAAAAFAAVGFGLYHFTHEERWHRWVGALVGEMLFIVGFFVATRNFWLTVAVHNAFAALGFTAEQYSPTDPLRLEGVDSPPAVVVMAAAFVLPCLYLHWLEWRRGQAPAPPPGK